MILSAVLLLLSAFFLRSIWLSLSISKTIRPGILLLVVAHPDDESTFFAPTLASYDSRHVHVVCLSNGNGDGLGSVREQEMLECCVKEHGMLKENVRALQDGFHAGWPTDVIARIVFDYVEQLKRKWPGEPIDVVTFDEEGVSSHPNHIDAYYGVKEMYLGQREWLEKGNVRVLKLVTEPAWRKILGPACLLWPWLYPEKDLLVNSDIGKTYRAMRHHASQFLWYPYGYRRLGAFFVRYSFVNRLVTIAEPAE